MVKYGLFIDYEWCTGCHSCTIACNQIKGLQEGVFGIRVTSMTQKVNEKKVIDYIPVLTDACNLCEERVSAGKPAACVLSCPANVIIHGTIEELAKLMKNKSVMWAPSSSARSLLTIGGSTR